MADPIRLPPGQQLAAPGKWPRVGEREPAAEPGWTGLAVVGCVRRPRTWTWDELAQLPHVERVVDVHCVTRWSKLAVSWGGILLADLLRHVEPTAEARFVSLVAHSTRQHSSSLVLPEALELGTLVARHLDGQLLDPTAGGPLRAVVPGRYFYKSVKWLARIELLAEDRLGYWEDVAGYHNHADPWQEERFITRGISRQELARRLTRQDFSAAEFLGLDLHGRQLPGLRADGAVLRNADFEGCQLAGASFEQANLSNARFVRADLRGARFAQADVEGADFRGADLRGADFRGAALLGVLFRTPVERTGPADEPQPGEAAIVDRSTLFDSAALEALAPCQAELVRARAHVEC